MDMNPENLDKAAQYVMSAMTNQECIKKTEVTRVTFQDTDMDISFVVIFRS